MTVLGTGGVEVRAADRAEPGTVRAAQQLRRHRQGERVMRPRLHIENIAFEIRAIELLGWLRHLPGINRHQRSGRFEAAHAWPGQLCLEPHAQRVSASGCARDVESCRHKCGLDLVALAA